MAKSRKHHSQKKHKRNLFKSIKKTSKKVIPAVNSGLKKVGKTVKFAAEKSAPVVEKGISGVYGALATGFDMGVKGVKSGVTMISKKRQSSKKRHGKTHKKK